MVNTTRMVCPERLAIGNLYVCRSLFIKNSNMKFLALFIINKHVSETNREKFNIVQGMILYIDKAI